jgi:hypothetical protein
MELVIIVIAGEILIGRCVSHPHVVRHHQYDIRPVKDLTGCKQRKKKEDQAGFHSTHPRVPARFPASRLPCQIFP